ncbi:MAG: glycosyltransferase family 9 protein [Planctomycetota bacterium]
MTATSDAILVVQFGSVDEVLMTTPVAMAIRKQRPDAHLIWLVSEDTRHVIDNDDIADETWTVPTQPNPASVIEQTWSLRRHISSDSIPHILYGEATTSRGLRLISWLLRLTCPGRHVCLAAPPNRTYTRGIIPRRVSAGIRVARECCVGESIPAVMRHFTDRQLELLTSLEIASPPVRWPRFFTESAEHWSHQIRATLPPQPLMMMHSGGVTATAVWPSDRFASTARYARDRYGYQTLVTWSTFEDRLRAEQIVSLSQDAAQLAPPTTFSSMAALTQIADVVVAGDSTPLHLAVAADTSTIAIYGATSAIRTGPYDRNVLCGRQISGRKITGTAAMGFVDVQHVCAQLDEMQNQNQIESHSTAFKRTA